MSSSNKGGAYGAPASDTSFRKTRDLDEAAAKAATREAAEKEERKARYEAKLAGKKYHKPLTGNEVHTTARSDYMDLTAQIGKTQLVPAGAGVGKRGRGVGFYCPDCDLTFKDNKQWEEHRVSTQHLLNIGESKTVLRATAEEVRERIDYWVNRIEEQAKEQDTSLEERLKLRNEENEKEAEIKREKRRVEAEKKRGLREEAEKVKTEYGEDVRVEGEHDEDDMMAAMGITGFGTSKK